MRPLFAAAFAAFAMTPQPQAFGPLSREPSVAGVRAYYGPGEEIGSIDARLIDMARTSIDMAAYVLSDRAVVSALSRAATRGVHVRIYLDGEEMTHSESAVSAIASTPNVELRQKHRSRDLMHMKSFAVDRRILRSGSANFSVSGEEYQDNDLIVIESPELAQGFEENFERLWMRVDNQRIGAR